MRAGGEEERDGITRKEEANDSDVKEKVKLEWTSYLYQQMVRMDPGRRIDSNSSLTCRKVMRFVLKARNNDRRI